jgi:hypothetical protein
MSEGQDDAQNTAFLSIIYTYQMKDRSGETPQGGLMSWIFLIGAIVSSRGVRLHFQHNGSPGSPLSVAKNPRKRIKDLH